AQEVYAVVRFADPDSGCDATKNTGLAPDVRTAESTAWQAVHEYTEAATDPQLNTAAPFATGTGWNTGSGFTPQEVADLCQNYIPAFTYIFDKGKGANGDYYRDSTGNPVPWPTYASVTGDQFTLPFLWSSADQGCVMAAGQEFVSPDTTTPFRG